ncbi:hypothetical protein GOODEAATRI_006747 [Goodea atripinnis]|uniref:Uncharacterized protein n=1 Tax=Goodea atripinnis TaxID=208336 RepID=A0ABV0MZ88_9TELE
MSCSSKTSPSHETSSSVLYMWCEVLFGNAVFGLCQTCPPFWGPNLRLTIPQIVVFVYILSGKLYSGLHDSLIIQWFPPCTAPMKARHLQCPSDCGGMHFLMNNSISWSPDDFLRLLETYFSFCIQVECA